MSFNNAYNLFLNLKVSYIVQAFEEDGKRIATDGLKEHKTLQRIYSDILSDNPSQDVWLILWKFEPYWFSIDGDSFGAATVLSEEETDQHLVNLLTISIDLDQEITFTEAALIRYFQPKYNLEYKTSFPSPSHSSYNQCYSMDINSAAFSLNSRQILNSRLYTNDIPPEFFHTKYFNLYSEADRKDRFKHFVSIK